MSKLPSIQFYPGDWHKDPGIRALDLECRGAWFELLLLMFESSERGRLLLNGKPMSDDAIAKCLGLDNQKSNQILTTLVGNGVASRDADGALYCRRMVRDEKIRKIRSESGKLGGNPSLLLKQNSTTMDNQIPTPSARKMNNEYEVEEQGKGVQGENPWAKFRDPCSRLFGKPTSMAMETKMMRLLPELAKVCDSVDELERRAAKYKKAFPDVAFTLQGVLNNWNQIPEPKPKSDAKRAPVSHSTRLS